MSSTNSSTTLPDVKAFGIKEAVQIHLDSPSTPSLEDKLAEHGIQRDASNNVTWRRDSKDHPRNWSTSRKLYDTSVIILLELYTTVISTTGPSAAAPASKEYGINTLTSLVAFSYMYQIGQAFGGLLIPPFSESFGRRNPYILSSAIFAIFCLITGVVPSLAGAFVGRFIAGFASAVPSVVIAGSVEDIFNSRRRVWLVLVWNGLATAGLIFGPIYGVYIESKYGWRWIYYSAAIGTAVLTTFCFGLKESRPSLLLNRKVERLRKTLSEELIYENHDAVPDKKTLINLVLIRPSRLLVSEPLVILVATLTAISWGIIYLFTEALTKVYMSMGLSKTTSSLPFLAIGVGIMFTIIPRFWDLKVVEKRRRNNEPLQPEDKLTGFLFAVPALAIGLWWFSWTIPPAVSHLSWIVPTIGLIFVGFAVNEMALTLSGYLADAYTVYAASAFAALAFLRAIVSGAAPLVAYVLYKNESANIAGSILAAVATAFCIAPVIMHRYSRDLRRRSKFARHSFEVYAMTRVEDD
ncbi:MAG: hypothetical protein M1820_007216 [Bogoriella megaspora]|nr:MAG: hypothetical protein M1820_007216 [Bogoriella megaspora]